MFESLLKPELQFKTLTGSIVTFNSQYALPLKSHTVNIDSVSGVSAINISATGKNLLPEKFYYGIPYNDEIGTVFNTTEITTGTKVDDSISFSVTPWGRSCMLSAPLPQGTYQLTMDLTTSTSSLTYTEFILDDTLAVVRKRYLQNAGTSRSVNTTIPLGEGERYIAISFGCSSAATITYTAPQLEVGETATSYEPYGTYTTITIGSTINEGVYNARTGVLEVTQPSVQTIQLPPCPIDTLEGVNNIWADTGDTTASYIKLG